MVNNWFVGLFGWHRRVASTDTHQADRVAPCLTMHSYAVLQQ